jgi:glycosyltransferase involved in cell wall biosynthesis
MKCSICMSTYDRPDILRRTLDSIFVQDVPFSCEVIVVDDGSPDQRLTMAICVEEYPLVRYARIDRPPSYRNPSAARNAAYKMAEGDVLICQSDDVMHRGNVVQQLVEYLQDGEFLLATVWNVDKSGDVVGIKRWPNIRQLTGPMNRRPLLFLGAVWREDMYAVGGCDEEFVDPGYDDDWLAKCLIRGRGLTPKYVTAEGYHQDHNRPETLTDLYRRSAIVYYRKIADAEAGRIPWQTSGGPWPP